MRILRKIIQIFFLVLLLLPIWYTDLLWYGTYISADLMGLQLTDPLTALEITLAGKSLWMPLLLSALPLTIVAVLLGRLFCSFVCPLNFLLELMPIKRKKSLKEKNLPLAALGIALLLSLILSLPAFNTVSPVFALMRMMLFADYYLPFIPSRDLALMNAMAQVIIEEGLTDEKFIADHTEFMKGASDKLTHDEYKAFLQDYTPEKVEASCGIPAATIREVARLFADPKRNTMSMWCMGFNQRSRGVWANNLVHNLHLLTGKICKPGNTPFSLTGQPSACGSVRETGGLSHILPAHRFVANEKHRNELEEIWGIPKGTMPSKPGYHTLEMFKAAVTGDLKCLWVMTTNPGQSLPNLDYYRPGMEKVFLVVSEAYHPTRTSELADVVLPAALWMEKEGIYGNGERRTNHIAKAVEPPGEARPDLQTIIDFGKRMGYEHLVPFKTPEEVWAEYQKCQEGTDMQMATYKRLREGHGFTWPVAPDPATSPETYIRYAEGYDPYVKEGEGIKFYCRKNNRAVIYARPQIDAQEMPDAEYPFFLTTGRMLEHWHTATMTGNVPELKNAAPEMYVEINEEDAKRLGINDGDLVNITSRRATCKFKAKINGRGKPMPGLVYVSFHDKEDDRLINKVLLDAFDPGSKQPEYKVCAVQITKAS